MRQIEQWTRSGGTKEDNNPMADVLTDPKR